MMKKSIVLSVAGIILSSMVIALPVRADGDSPQEVYADYIAAARDRNMDEICKYISDGKVQQIQSLSQEEKEKLADKMKRMAPTKYTVTKEEINGIHAALFLSGELSDSSGGSRSARGKARFIKEGDEWKLEKEMWQ